METRKKGHCINFSNRFTKKGVLAYLKKCEEAQAK